MHAMGCGNLTGFLTCRRTDMRVRTVWASLVVMASALVCLPAMAAGSQHGFWSTPTIHGYGKIHYVADGSFQPKADQTYKIVFTLTKAPKAPNKVNSALDHVARTVNIFVAAGVPLDHLKIVAVAAGPGTELVLDNAHYKAKYGVDNPNLDLIKQLHDAGVNVSVCAQAMGEHHLKYSWRAKDVSLSLSALSTVITLQHEGYALEPM
jgi:intracellular sulfur oxidation DsrE/DsrF family protein